MAKRLYKIAGTPGSSGINSSPTVIGEEGNDVDVIVWGPSLDGEAAARLSETGPVHESGVRIPRSVLLEAAARLAGTG
jgi:hypothetical protein